MAGRTHYLSFTSTTITKADIQPTMTLPLHEPTIGTMGEIQKLRQELADTRIKLQDYADTGMKLLSHMPQVIKRGNHSCISPRWIEHFTRWYLHVLQTNVSSSYESCIIKGCWIQFDIFLASSAESACLWHSMQFCEFNTRDTQTLHCRSFHTATIPHSDLHPFSSICHRAWE